MNLGLVMSARLVSYFPVSVVVAALVLARVFPLVYSFASVDDASSLPVVRAKTKHLVWFN